MAEEEKKKENELAKMGDLDKGISQAEGESAPAQTEEPAAESAPPASEDADLKIELEREKEKNKSLAAIIEKVSSSAAETPAPAAPAPAPAGSSASDVQNIVNSQMKDVKDAVVAIGKRVEEVSKTAAKPERTGSKVKDMVDKMQADTGKKIEEIEEQMKNMITKLEAPAESKENVAEGLSAFGGRVGFKNEMLALRTEMKDMQSSL
ncbi:MAG: hypothetical protein KAS04_05220, partial [Candidatus Aenigmarchaeota archaeon]|nr:hypothetical protein [Candidatus Aenigmarchaeota archaeon]